MHAKSVTHKNWFSRSWHNQWKVTLLFTYIIIGIFIKVFIYEELDYEIIISKKILPFSTSLLLFQMKHKIWTRSCFIESLNLIETTRQGHMFDSTYIHSRKTSLHSYLRFFFSNTRVSERKGHTYPSYRCKEGEHMMSWD